MVFLRGTCDRSSAVRVKVRKDGKIEVVAMQHDGWRRRVWKMAVELSAEATPMDCSEAAPFLWHHGPIPVLDPTLWELSAGARENWCWKSCLLSSWTTRWVGGFRVHDSITGNLLITPRYHPRLHASCVRQNTISSSGDTYTLPWCTVGPPYM